MPLQEIKFEYDIPEGYRFVRYGCPKRDEHFLEHGKVQTAGYAYETEWPIVERVLDCNGPAENPKRRKHADLIHAWAEGAIIQFKLPEDAWEDCINNSPAWGVGQDYRIKPAIKTIKFRNWLTKSGKIVAWAQEGHPIEVIENQSNFARWVGDWQSVEVEEQ